MKISRSWKTGSPVWLLAAVMVLVGGTGCADEAASALDGFRPSAVPIEVVEEPQSEPVKVDVVEEAQPEVVSIALIGDETDPSDYEAVRAVLADLAVKGRAPKTGYDRDLFGPRWADTDHNGCDTRNDILTRDLTETSYRPGTNDCVVVSGKLDDPYTASTINFERGQDTSSAVQIDHVVALSDAWQKGAQQLSDDLRTQFANDPLNLLAVDGPANQKKSDGDAATWLPSNKAFRCEYVARQVLVKAKYSLWVTPAEHDAIDAVLEGCIANENAEAEAARVAEEEAAAAAAAEEERIAQEAAAAAEAARVAEEAAAAEAARAAEEAASVPSSVYYKNCSAARAAGAAPVYEGDPGYGTHLDRDRDGVGCE